MFSCARGNDTYDEPYEASKPNMEPPPKSYDSNHIIPPNTIITCSNENQNTEAITLLRQKLSKISEHLTISETKRCSERKAYEEKIRQLMKEKEQAIFECNGQHMIDLSQFKDMKQREIEFLKSSLQKQKEEHDVQQMQIFSMSTKIVNLETELHQQKNKYTQEIDSLNNAYENELKSLTTQRDENFQEQRATLLRRTMLAESEYQKLSKLYQEIHVDEKQVEKYHDKIQDLENECTSRLQRIHELESNIAHLQQTAELSQRLAKEKYEADIARLETDLSNLQNIISDLNKELITTQNKLHEREKVVEATHHEKEKQSEFIGKLVRAKTMVEEGVIKVQEENRDLMQTLNKMRQANDEFMRMLAKVYERQPAVDARGHKTGDSAGSHLILR